VNVCDWRDVAPDVVTPLYARARQRWLRSLGWETSATWRRIEEARTTWGLPGVLAVDDAGRVQGWMFFLPHEDVLQVGGLAADSPLATRALLDALVEIGESSGARGLSCFMFDEAPGVAAELTRRGFETEPFLYYSRDIARNDRAARSDTQAWPAGDLDMPATAAGAAALLQAAYSAEDSKYLAPGHTLEGWARYVRNLVEQTGLGEMNHAATRVLRGRDGRLEALVLVTTLSAATAHIAQVAVHPSRRGEGLAAALVEEACDRAARQGCTRVTLLAGASNSPARRLYERLGFTAGPLFLAGRSQSLIAGR
jgi:ribosomal protein S18 acetylase RimI-like enzyme